MSGFLPVIVLCSTFANKAPMPDQCVTVEDEARTTQTYTACQVAAADMVRDPAVFAQLREYHLGEFGEVKHGVRFFVSCQKPESMEEFMRVLPEWVIMEYQNWLDKQEQDV